ncbi:MAG: disulfide bond formation protein DsbA [Candidatus Buchananbacteria bacterium CG10_big_fil_rev_8_21_14_0_10_42_9]|uniref:Disulfide bond formation protein DsbA n=1 Tax=Candidatus Buchananbacteria bacterium CG10_big_fil_rev_8_21_14_0_10_42_9 TaxID=1974526 RepID=A0A2H0VZY2_9BACT|nr:MAG: disulfide bond formation protein DsbA [Candidatus Buchananbacteria bacterium CG10_big_fil_rev_8_21_14_0_10_42_9]
MGFFKKLFSHNGPWSEFSSSQSFILGAGWGIAASSTLSLLVLLVLIFNGNAAISIGSKESGTVAKSGAAPTAPSQPTAPSAPSAPTAQLRPVDSTDYIRGNPDAKVTMIEYSDFQCPFCQRHLPTINQILQAYPNDVNLVYRHFPLRSIHPEAQKAAEASECAGEQGKFWEMHDALFAAGQAGNLSVTTYKQLAGQIGLNQNQFDSCLDSDKMAAKVQQHLSEGQAAGVTGTPGTFVNGQLVRGAVPYSTFQQIIQSQL